MSLVPYVHVDADLAGAVPGTTIALTDEERHHLVRVLRLHDGDQVEVADGGGTSGPARLEGDHLVADELTHLPPPRPELWIAQALPKGRKLDEVVRQVTELGVDGIVVVSAEHSVARLDPAKVARSRDRWVSVARAASEQSRRPHRPEVCGPVLPAELLEQRGVLVVTDPGGPSLSEVVRAIGDPARVTVAVGPEGGWSVRERDAFDDAGAIRAGLGPTVLRTEHAAAAALAVVAALLGRWER